MMDLDYNDEAADWIRAVRDSKKKNTKYVVKSLKSVFRKPRANELGEEEKANRKKSWKEDGEPQSIKRIKGYAKRRREENLLSEI